MKIVLKLGGELFNHKRQPELNAIAADAQSLFGQGESLVFVHGGGAPTTKLMRRLGQKPHMTGGRRITDDDALEAIKMVVGGKLNIELCRVLQVHGLNAVGLHGVSGRVLACEKRPPRIVTGCGDQPVDFGHVGDVTGINRELIELLLSHAYVPVLACIGSDAAGKPYNINADAVASGVAQHLQAERLVFLTDTSGVLCDVQDPKSRIPEINVTDAKQAIAQNTIKGGMIPKLEASFAALKNGTQYVHILGQLAPGELRAALQRPGEVGTIVRA